MSSEFAVVADHRMEPLEEGAETLVSILEAEEDSLVIENLSLAALGSDFDDSLTTMGESQKIVLVCLGEADT